MANDVPENQLFNIFQKYKTVLQETGAELYSAVWPEWEKYHTVQISVQFLDKTAMARINHEYRNVDGATDVLTFPLFEKNNAFVPDSDTYPLLLGDILLCTPVISRNAAEHKVSEISELALVFFHGMLHLLAWDHDTPEKQAKMWSVQDHFKERFLACLKSVQS